MPPLQLFRRNWHISSDDLALPACIGVAFHGTWASLLAAEVVIIGLPDDCEGRQLASSSVLWLLVSFALTTLLQCVVAGVSMRGAMLEEYKRAAMPTALYCLLSAYTLEAAALVYATIVNFGVLRDTLSTCHTAEELARTSISELSLHRWFIGTTWAMLLVISSLLWLMYNLYPDRGLESWEKRVNCMSYILCCRKSLTADPDSDGAQSSSAPTVVRLARVFGDLFYPLNFSFTDTVAAITLVGITHRSSAHGHGSSSHNHALIAAAGAGVLSPAKHDAPSGAGALLEAAVAYAAAPNGAAKPLVLTAQHAGEAKQSADSGPMQLAEGHTNAAAVDGSPAAGAGVAGSSHEAVCLQRAQELQLAERATSSPCLAAAGDGGAPATSGGQRCPSPGRLGIRHSGSTGNMQAAGLDRGAEPSSASFTRTASSSAWEAAVRQGSTLAVAPGHGFLPTPAAAGVNLAGNRASSSVASEPAIPTRSHSTAADGAAALPPPRFSNRAVSWGGTTAAFHPSTAHSTEPGSTQPLLQSLAESNELSLASGIEQVQSLLSPVQSAGAAATEGPAAAGVQQLGVPPAGDAFGTAGAAVASGAAAQDAVVQDSAAVFANPLYSPVIVPQPDIVAAAAAGQAVRRTPGGAPAAAASPVMKALVAAAALEEGLPEDVGSAVTSTGQPVPLELLEEALHWHAYANAIYGWPMFLWSHRYRVLRCCRLCCGGCCKGVPHSARSSAGGLSMHQHALSNSTDEALAGNAVSKPGSFNNSSSGALNSSVNGTGPVTAVVTMSSVDTDSVSPGSTTAGAAADGGGLNSVRPNNGPLGEGVEDQPGSPRRQQQVPDAAAACVWDVEQGGGVRGAQVGTSARTAAAAAGGGSSSAEAPGAPAGTGRSSGSRRWVQSSGNVWLLQGLADVLGITRDAAAAADVGSKSPRGSTRGSGGGGPGLTSVASGLGDDQGPCGCLCGGKWGASHVPKMAPLSASQRLTNEAIMQTANIPAADLLYVNYNNLVEGLLPYSVALDAARRCVVVAIRGSLSVEDCVTDILYDPAPLDEDWLLQQPTAEAAAAAADPCNPTTWPQHPSTAAALAAYEDPAAAQQHVATEEALRQLQQQLQQQQQAPDWQAADAAQQSSLGLGLPTPSRSMIGASSGGGSFRSVKASPFASAAAAASIAASHTSGSVQQPPRPPLPSQQPPPQQPPQQQQQPSSGLVCMPSVPAAQAAAAAAAAASQPLAAGGRPLRRHWSVNFVGLQQQDQQQQAASPKLLEQPSFLRRAAGALRPHPRQQQRQSQDDEQQQRPQQQQLRPLPSVLDTALSLLRGPWRRSSNASDAGEGRRRRTSTRESDAAVAAEEGRGRGLGNFIHGRRTSSIEHSSIQETGFTSPRSPRRLFKTFSLNLGAGRGVGAQQQQQLPGVRRRTTSSRMMGAGREHMLQTCASEHIPSAASPRRSTAESWRQSQMHRTTAADRALGAARAGHRYAPMTSPATDQSAAAAAARDRTYMQHLHQQQQHLQQQLTTMQSMRSTAPASTHSPAAAGAGTGASPGTASEPGRALQHDVMQHYVMPGGSPATSAVGSRVDTSAGASPRSGYSSRRATFTQLPRINSGGGAAGGGPEQQQQQQQQLSMMASVPVPPLALQQQQQQQAAARARRASDEGSSVGGSSIAAGQRPSLHASVSDMALRARRLGMLLSMSRAQAHSQQQQATPQLSDGGPTDFSLLAGAATMVPSRTAAVPPAAAEAAPSSGAGSFLRTSFSARPAPVGSFAGLSTSHSLSTRPPGTPSSLAGHSVEGQSAEGFAIGLAGRSTAGALTAGQTAAAAAGGEVSSASDIDVSPFMLLQQPAVEAGLCADVSTAAAAHVMGDGLLPAAPSTQQELWGIQQQQQQSLMEPCMDGSPTAAIAAAPATAAVEAAFAEEQEAAAAAEADAVAAAAQAAAAEQTPDTGAAGAQWFAHEGILNCARAIRDDLDRLGLLDQLLLGSHQPPAAAAANSAFSPEHQDEPGTLQDSSSNAGAAVGNGAAACCAAAAEGAGAAGCTGVAGAGAVRAGAGGAEEGRFMSSSEMPDCRGWTLVLTGHSLGAGVAALLGLHYRARYASVRCWCFAPPGGLMSPAAASSLKDICYSLVSAKDMIPRMSLWTIERLRDEMMICALRCKMPKYKLLLGAALGKKWSEEEVLRPLEELTDAEVMAFQDYRRAVVEERSLDPLRVRIAREFVPPGEVLWLERNKMLQPRLRVLNTLSTRPGPPAAPDAAQLTSTAAAAGALDGGDGALVGNACVAGASPAIAAAPTAAAATASVQEARSLVASSSPASRPADTPVAPSAPTAPTPAAVAAAPGSGKGYGGNSMLRGGSAALEAAAVAVAGKRVVSRLQPRITDGLGIIVGGMVVSRNMFADHVPDKQLYMLKRLVRYLKRQQALGRPLPPGIEPVLLKSPPAVQQGMSRRMQ